jgi:hypothetical protein
MIRKVEDGPLTTLAIHTDVEVPVPPASSMSPADVGEVLPAGGDLDTVKQDIPITNPASLVNGHPPATSSTSEKVSASLYEECKQLVVQLVVQNAQAREPDADIAAQSEKLEKRAAVLVTDECCMDFIATAKRIQEQMIAMKDSSVKETGASRNVDSVVGAKRRRDEVDDAESSMPNKIRVRVESDKSGLVRVDSAISSVPSSPATNKPAPRAPKAMIKKQQHMNKIMSMVPPSPYDISESISPAQNGTRVRSNSQHEIPIPSDEKYFRHPTSPNLHGSYGNTNWAKRYERDYDEGSQDVDHRHRDSRNSDLGTDRERRTSDTRQREIRKESRSAESHSERSERRRRDRDDLDDRERDYSDEHHSLRSDSRKHSPAKSKSNHRTSDDLIATRMSAPEMSVPVDTRLRKPLQIIPTCPVPGLWFVKVGLEQADILDVEFQNFSEIATQDHLEDSSGITFHLLCLPTNSVRETFETLDQAASPQEVTDAMWNIKTQWPPRGKLLIEVNPGDTVGRSWLPFELASTIILVQKSQLISCFRIGPYGTSIKFDDTYPTGTKYHSFYSSW